MKGAILLLTMVLVTTNVFGQNFTIGGEFGVSSSINNDYEITDFENRRNTYYAGLNLNYQFNERITFSLGLHLLRQGYRHSTCYVFEEGVKNQLVGKIDYLTMPITANFYLLKSRKLVTTIGLLGGYNTKARQVYPEQIGGCDIYYVPDLSLVTQDFSWSGIIGLGYKVVETNRIELIPMVKYYQGLTNTFKNPRPDISLNIDRKYSTALLSVMLNYKL